MEDDLVFSGAMVQVFSLSADKSMQLVGTFPSGEAVLQELGSLKPDIMLTDLRMPGMGGIALISEAKDILPEMEIIALTAVDDIETVFSALKAGATGYLLKTSSMADIFKAIDDTHKGGTAITPSLACAMVEEFRSYNLALEYQPGAKEKKILQKLSEGLTYKEIAEELGMSINAIHWNMKNIISKLHAKNKKDAISKAKKLGLIK